MGDHLSTWKDHGDTESLCVAHRTTTHTRHCVFFSPVVWAVTVDFYDQPQGPHYLTYPAQRGGTDDVSQPGAGGKARTAHWIRGFVDKLVKQTNLKLAVPDMFTFRCF